MFRKIEDFLGSWAYETEATLKVFEQLTDASLGQKWPRRVGPWAASPGTSPRPSPRWADERVWRSGVRRSTIRFPPPAAEISARFKEAADSLGDEVRNRWTDGDLEVEDDMYGETWPRGQTLAALLNHQTHHRGQMTVLMRQAGLQVPGVYGPPGKSGTAYGMPAQE